MLVFFIKLYLFTDLCQTRVGRPYDKTYEKLLLLLLLITYDAIKVTLYSKLLQGHCKEFEFDDVQTLYANLEVRR